MQQCAVFVYLPGDALATPAGVLSWDYQTYAYAFRYGQPYLASPRAVPVDPLALPLSDKEFILPHDILGAIRDAAPDAWGRMVIEKAQGRKDLTEIEYLLQPNAVRIGNLDFSLTPDTPRVFYEPPSVVDLPHLLVVADAIMENVNITDKYIAYIPLLCQGSSLGGARPKCVVKADDGIWIAKFPAKSDKWNNARVEYATMRIANLCGIDIPEMRIQQIWDADVLLVKRFDRTAECDRLGYLSALSLLQIADNEYQKFSYLELADKMRIHGMQRQLEELFTRIAFNIICRNTDDHPRNHGFLHYNGKMWLSPAFDVVATSSKEGVSSIPYMSMTLGIYGKEGTLDNLISCAVRFGLTQEEGRDIFINVASIASGIWEDVFRDAGVSIADMEDFAHTFASNKKRLNDEEKQDTCWPAR